MKKFRILFSLFVFIFLTNACQKDAITLESEPESKVVDIKLNKYDASEIKKWYEREVENFSLVQTPSFVNNEIPEIVSETNPFNVVPAWDFAYSPPMLGGKVVFVPIFNHEIITHEWIDVQLLFTKNSKDEFEVRTIFFVPNPDDYNSFDDVTMSNFTGVTFQQNIENEVGEFIYYENGVAKRIFDIGTNGTIETLSLRGDDPPTDCYDFSSSWWKKLLNSLGNIIDSIGDFLTKLGDFIYSIISSGQGSGGINGTVIVDGSYVLGTNTMLHLGETPEGLSLQKVLGDLPLKLLGKELYGPVMDFVDANNLSFCQNMGEGCVTWEWLYATALECSATPDFIECMNQTWALSVEQGFPEHNEETDFDDKRRSFILIPMANKINIPVSELEEIIGNACDDVSFGEYEDCLTESLLENMFLRVINVSLTEDERNLLLSDPHFMSLVYRFMTDNNMPDDFVHDLIDISNENNFGQNGESYNTYEDIVSQAIVTLTTEQISQIQQSSMTEAEKFEAYYNVFVHNNVDPFSPTPNVGNFSATYEESQPNGTYESATPFLIWDIAGPIKAALLYEYKNFPEKKTTINNLFPAQVIGTAGETGSLNSLNIPKNKSPLGDGYTSIPDGIFYRNMTDGFSVYPTPFIVEIKTISNKSPDYVFNYSDNPDQYQDYLGYVESHTHRNNETMFGGIYLITTDIPISQVIIDQATQKNISFYHSTIQIDNSGNTPKMIVGDMEWENKNDINISGQFFGFLGNNFFNYLVKRYFKEMLFEYKEVDFPIQEAADIFENDYLK